MASAPAAGSAAKSSKQATRTAEAFIYRMTASIVPVFFSCMGRRDMAVEVATARRLFTREEPDGRGGYPQADRSGRADRDVSRVAGAATVSPAAFPDVILPLAEIFA